MVSLKLRPALRIRIWPIPAGDGSHNGVTGVGTDQRAVIQHAGNGRYRHAPARRATSRMVIISTALFEFKMLTNAPLAGGYFVSTPPVAA